MSEAPAIGLGIVLVAIVAALAAGGDSSGGGTGGSSASDAPAAAGTRAPDRARASTRCVRRRRQLRAVSR